MVREISAVELKAMIDRGERFELIDVRTPVERDIASLEGARLLDQREYDDLIQMDEETPIVFLCHHGNRSRAARELQLSRQALLYLIRELEVGGTGASRERAGPSLRSG